MSLRDYARKRRFADTPEPSDEAGARGRGRGAHRPVFVVQLHNARARHYDFRLEADGVLKSWAVPKGPSLRAGEKRLAVEVEDHPLAYGGFEGEIPEGNYGAGHVLVFDQGVWSCDGDPLAGIAAGKLDFTLEGGKLRGGWKLIRTSRPGRGGKPQWLLVKRDDDFARDTEADDLVEVEPDAQSSAAAGRQWIAGKGERKRKVPPKAGARAAGKTTGNAALTERGPRKQDAAWTKRARALQGARSGGLAPGFKPELATLREHAPRGDDWLHEVKWDGYRLLADLVDGQARLRSRNDLDWTGDFPAIAAAIEALPVRDARLDGELVALANGTSDFALLQRTLQGTANAALHYVLFDVPGIAGVDLSNSALLDRKALLEALLQDADASLLYSAHVVGHGQEVFAAAAARGLEGIISKRVDAAYTQRRSKAWIKVKHAQADEFAIVGFSAPKGTRSGFGALLLATPETAPAKARRWRYVGRVGTGFNDATLRMLLDRMAPLARKTAPVTLPEHLPYDKRDRGDITWLTPKLVAEVAYRGWGKDGLLRHASFQRLREDKTVEDLDMPGPPPHAGKTHARTAAEEATRKRSGDATARVEVSSRDRVVFDDAGITKGDVADYYAAVADWILPGLAERPLSLLRCPGGAGAPCFFQKHHAESLGAQVPSIELAESSGRDEYLYIRDAAGLLELVQMNVLEFHPWGARVDKPEKPDTLVFDLDPGPGVDWKQVVAGARDVRERLQDAGLDSFVRLSGGKGVHVVAPIRRGPGWQQAKDFCGAFAEAMAAHKPLAYVATMSKAKRKDRIFIDWLRNGRGATSVCNWSLRARGGAPVAMPLRWDELGRTKAPDAFDLGKALKRARSLKRDPWEGYATCRQSLPKFS